MSPYVQDYCHVKLEILKNKKIIKKIQNKKFFYTPFRIQKACETHGT